MANIKVYLVPLLVLPLGLLAWIFCVVGMSGDDEGWGENDNGFKITWGWDEVCVKGAGCGELKDENKDGGIVVLLACILGCIMAPILGAVAIWLGLAAHPINKFYRIVSWIAGGTYLCLGFVLMIGWIVWVAATADDRDDIDVGVGPYFFLAMVATCFFCCSGAILFIGSFIPVRVFPPFDLKDDSK
eukprot:TRINITY_DN12812_c0_g1_i1.p1 TRINITY_DN12812_c0_g1~~TRINITY_DN12812_c0_g1_i1.p1  ORF type:complete len:201 (-),score=31.32 TRINITY_DN12812_c0_g1_i1:63-623(-)